MREVRDHRAAIQALKSYIGTEPPPTYHPTSLRRRCAVIGGRQLGKHSLKALVAFLESCNYTAVVVNPGIRLPDDMAEDGSINRAALCVSVVEGLTPVEIYLLGALRATLTPIITLTLDAEYLYSKMTPREYQPRYVPKGDADELLRTVEQEIEIFEEDYLELKEEQQVHRYRKYRDAVMKTRSTDGNYSHEERERAFIVIERAEVDMSTGKVHVSNVVGPVNIQSRLDNVTQTVQQLHGWPDARKKELTALLSELTDSLKAVADVRPDDAERVAKSAEFVVSEAMKAKPDKGFLSITTEGLKKAAEAVADIAPTVLAVAAKVASFVSALP